MKKVRRILFYLLVSIVVIVIAIVSSVLLYKEKIIRQFVAEANKHLTTPVKIGKIDVSMFEDFPRLSIVLSDVYVEDSHPGEYPLLTAATISFSMDAFDLWKGNYVINGLRVTNSETVLKVDSKGVNNYTIATRDQSTGNQSISFALQNVELINTHVRYIDTKASLNLLFDSRELDASITTENDIYRIDANGNVVTKEITVDGETYFAGKSFEIATRLIYNDIGKHLRIDPTTLQLSTAGFEVEGSYSWKKKNIIDLKSTGKNTDIQTLLSLLPEKVRETLSKYESKGEVYFRGNLKGEISSERLPFLNVEFGFDDATIFHPDYRTRIEDASMTGSFATADLSDRRQGTLVLKNVSGKFNSESFTGNLVISNFLDPQVIFDFKGKLDAASVLNFYPIEGIRNVSGSMNADISFEGKIAYLKEKATAQRVSTLGTIDLEKINLTYGRNEIRLDSLNGSLQFNHNDLALSNVSCRIGDSDFLLNGFFKNVITFMLFENQPIGIETDLKSDHVNLEELFNLGFGETNSDEEFSFSISPNVFLNFNCDIQSLHYKRFHARNVTGDLLVKNEVAVSRNLSFESMGGSLTLSGILDAKNPKATDVVSTIKLVNVNADSAFFVFENFRQDFIQDKHLRGKATAEINLEMTLNQHLRLFQETLVADINMSIVDGQLNNFEPMKSLNRYVDDETLGRLRFGELRNQIHIENKTVYIPEMYVRSNATELKISGTHTFDQNINYRIATPLRRKRILDVDAQTATDTDMDGQTKLFLKITGTTDDYKVSYDTEAVKKKIATDLKKEVNELRDAFRTKGKKKAKEAELEKDEYFDWEN